MSGASGPDGMDRRAFLRLAMRGQARVLDLSCERFYLRWVDARPFAAEPGRTPGRGRARAGALAEAGARAESGARADAGVAAAARVAPEGEGEPPLDVVAPTRAELLAELERSLAGVQVVRVGGREWLASGDFRREVEARLEAFRRRGGRVE